MNDSKIPNDQLVQFNVMLPFSLVRAVKIKAAVDNLRYNEYVAKVLTADLREDRYVQLILEREGKA